MVSSGPETVLKCWRDPKLVPDQLSNSDTRNIPWIAITEALEKLPTPPNGTSEVLRIEDKIILDDVCGETEKCSFFSTVASLILNLQQATVVRLFGESTYGAPRVGHVFLFRSLRLSFFVDWHLLKGHLDYSNPVQYLPGLLRWNQTEIAPFSKFDEFTVSVFIREHLKIDTEDWSEGQSLCIDCVSKSLGKHLMQWLIERKVQGALDLALYELHALLSTLP